MKNILITGVTGILGEKLCESYLKSGLEKLVLISRNKPRAEKQLSGIFKKYESNVKQIYLIEADISSSNLNLSYSERKILGDVDKIYHLAANTSLKNNKEEVFKTNVNGTKNLLNLFKNEDIDLFNHFSSAYACGKTEGFIDETWFKKPLDFRNPYEESKWIAEEIINEYHKKYNLPFTIFRPSILACANPNIRKLKKQTFYSYFPLITKVAKMNLKKGINKPLKLKGDPNSNLNIVFAEDVIKLVHAVEKKSDINKIFNLIGTDINIQDLVNLAGDLKEVDYKFDFTPNLDLSNLSRGELFVHNQTRFFSDYIDNPINLRWGTKNTSEIRKSLNLKEITKEQISENFKKFLKNNAT